MRLSLARLSSTLVLWLAIAHTGAAQDVRTLAAGVQVRVRGVYATEHGDRIYVRQGRLVGTDSTRLVLDDLAHVDTLPFFAMKRLEVHGGEVQRQRLVGVGAVTGALMGGAIWGLVKLISSSDDGVELRADGTRGGHGYGQLERLSLFSIPVLAGAGAAVGGMSSRDIWLRVSIPGALHPDP